MKKENNPNPFRSAKQTHITRTAFRAVILFLFPWGSLLANPLTEGQTLNKSQESAADVMFEICSTRKDAPGVDPLFRERCVNMVSAARKEPGSPEIANVLFQITPEQLASYGVETTRTMAGNINIVTTAVLGRLQTLHAGLDSIRFAGIQFYQDGQPLTGGNAGSDAFGNLGIWINGSFHLGEVDSTPALRGFNFKNWGVTAGADYRVLDNLVLGGAFSYILSDNDFDHNGGHADNDSYLGTLYGSFHPLENFYIDGMVTYGHINFDLTRNIRYTIPTEPVPVDARARGNTDGSQWGFTVSSGYEFHWQAFNFTPYARFSYLRLRIDDYHETGGAGLALRFEEQHIRSMKSVAGAQLSYTVSVPWGVLTPQAWGEWHHEFRDPSRTITASYLGDPVAQPFFIRVPPPDRDYAIFGGSLNATLAHGISAFIGYEALVGYRHVSSHRITVGARLQF